MSNSVLLIVLLFTALLSWYLVGRLIALLNTHQIVDRPNERSLHQGVVPRGGGLVIVALLLVILLVMAVVSQRYSVFAGLSLLVFAWAALSWWDDRWDLSARKRLLFQMLFAAATILAFGYITHVQISNDYSIWLSGSGAIITFVGIMWLANLYNFMDGMDGLVATQTIIVSITLAFWFAWAGDPHLSLVCLVLAAASYGFLLWNWQPAKIFLGDVGSVTIGAFFATLIIFGNTRYQIPVLSFVLLLGVFVADASVTLLRRILKREKIWLPHRSHYYQRLAQCGIEHPKIVFGLTILMLICSLIASFTVIEHDRIWHGALLELVLFIIGLRFVIHRESAASVT